MKHSKTADDSFAFETAEMEINLLKAQIEKYENIIMYANKTIETQEKEIQRLMDIVNPKCQQCVLTIIESAKSEAIHEFANRLIKETKVGTLLSGCHTCVINSDEINNIVEEMVGDKIGKKET